MEVFQALRAAAPKATILVLGILPRGLKDKWSKPGHDVVYHQQPSQFTPAIRAINKQLQAFVKEQPNALFQDCGELFLTDEGHLDPELMPDALHPGTAGMDILATCVDGKLFPALAWE
jgi:lysophospholipase L1-like esterase